LQQRQIVLKVPVVGDLPVLHAIYVNRAEANLATIAFQIFEIAGEMSGEEVSDQGARSPHQACSFHIRIIDLRAVALAEEQQADQSGGPDN
jgi:hypothetical protein